MSSREAHGSDSQDFYMSMAGKKVKLLQWIVLRNGWKVVQMGSDLYHILDTTLLVTYFIVPFLLILS